LSDRQSHSGCNGASETRSAARVVLARANTRGNRRGDLDALKFLAINGIVPPGQTDPTLLRVTGEALLCPSNQVEVISSITAASGPVALDPVGRFRVDLPITATPGPHCRDAIQFVRADCIGSTPPCYVQDTGFPLPCCEIGTLFFDAVVPLDLSRRRSSGSKASSRAVQPTRWLSAPRLPARARPPPWTSTPAPSA
jgi:hypothetical protein